MAKEENIGYLLKDIITKSKWNQIDDIMRESQLYDGLSIETWKRIADAVQKFEISDGSSKELRFNLEQIGKCLEKISMDHLQTGDNNVDHFWRIGVATLIEQIYAMSAPDKKEYFTKQIETLEKIGVDSIALSTDKGHTGTILGIETSHTWPDKRLLIDKVYTDGTFCIENYGGYSHQFNIIDLRGENYHISCELTSEEDGAKLWKAKAYLNNFQGKYPTKEEILQLRQPKIVPLREDDSCLARFLEIRGLRGVYEELITEFLKGKNLYQDYVDFLATTTWQEPIEWQVTKKRVRQVLE